MSKLNQQLLELGSVEKTLVIPLWARAEETQNGGLINDPMSVKFINKLDTSIFGFSEMSGFIRNYLLTAIANRTILIDRFLTNAITSTCTVLNFGCGLDTRFSRFSCALWYDIDMPEVIALRRNFVSETDHYKMLQADILDEALFSRINVSGDIVVICEGLLMYFEEAEVMGFLSRLIKNTHSGSLIIESLGSFAKLKVNPVIKGIGENSRYVWTINNPEKLQVNNCLSAVESMTIFDINKERWGIYGKLMSSNYLNKRVSSKITQYRYECQS